ncbi:hypothetical protein PR202_ga30390 [Eleusine coracana subsp. coracana]|uniref:Uncharacterized protein n=1 Tax=Eleusine coracana subsp. coracana TaxID=191504 RepID=A0AAV5DNV1_ELECO|nr:hypothetical protein PR202_ga30390 [Eleusine coracana subsp. coracana]
MLSSSETCHLGSSSNNPDMDPNNATVDEQILLPNALENDSFPRYLLNSHEMGMPSGNHISQQSTGLSLWESAGSSSMGCLADHGNFFQSKREHFAPPLSIGGPLTIGRRRHEGTGSLPSHNLNIDLNINQSDQFGMEDVDVVQSRTTTVLVNRGSTAERLPRHDFSLEAIGSSSRTADPFDGVASQDGGVLDSHRLTFKRKNIDGTHAESSANGSSHNRHQRNNSMLPAPAAQESTSLAMPTATNYAVSYPPVEQLNQNTNVATSGSLSDHYSLYNDPHEHGFVRNTRMRISPNDYDQSLPSLLPEGSFRCSSYQPAPQSSSFIPVQPRQASPANAHGRPHLPAVTQFSQNLHRPSSSNGNFGSQLGGSSSSADTTIHISSSHDLNRSMMRNDLPEPLLLGSSLYNADSMDFPSAPGSRSNQQNSIYGSSATARAAVNVGAQQVHGTNSSLPSTTVRGSADTARRSLISAGVRSSSIALPHRGSSSTSHEVRSHQPGSSSRAPQQHYIRGGPPSADRQNSSYLDLQSFMQTIAASRDGTRTVSEVSFP